MKLAALFALLALPAFGQTASTTVNSTQITTVVKDTAGTVYTVTTPYSTAIQLGSATLTVTPPVTTPPPPPPPGEPVIPSTAKTIDLLSDSVPWKMNHDAGTPGSSTGMTQYPFTAPDGSAVRLFQFTLTAKGGEIYHVHVLDDATAYKNYCYETVESSPDWSNIENAEKDLERVYPNGDVLDMASQLAGTVGRVEITGNSHWQQTSVAADPSKFAPTVLHTTRHYVRDNGNGTVTYVGTTIDGVYHSIGVTVNDLKTLSWSHNILNIQLQYDGKSSGSVQSTIYMYALRVHAW